MPADARLIVLADKIHNAEATLADLKSEGAGVWDRFRGGRDGTIWYHDALASHFEAAMPGPLAARLRTAIAGMEAF